MLGGLIAVAANVLLWPAWQPEQVDRDLRTAIAAHAGYARAVLVPGGTDPGRERRQAGLASNNLEASLQRAMHEPRRGQYRRMQAVLAADATLRRIAGRLAAISLDQPRRYDAAETAWIVTGLQAMADRQTCPPRPQPVGCDEQLTRLARQVELLGFTLQKNNGDSHA